MPCIKIRQCPLLKRMQLTFYVWVESVNVLRRHLRGKHKDLIKNMSLNRCMTCLLVAIC